MEQVSFFFVGLLGGFFLTERSWRESLRTKKRQTRNMSIGIRNRTLELLRPDRRLSLDMHGSEFRRTNGTSSRLSSEEESPSTPVLCIDCSVVRRPDQYNKSLHFFYSSTPIFFFNINISTRTPPPTRSPRLVSPGSIHNGFDINY